jgi:hypothetical protein
MGQFYCLTLADPTMSATNEIPGLFKAELDDVHERSSAIIRTNRRTPPGIAPSSTGLVMSASLSESRGAIRALFVRRRR